VSIGGIFKPTMDRIEKLDLQTFLGDLGGGPANSPAHRRGRPTCRPRRRVGKKPESIHSSSANPSARSASPRFDSPPSNNGHSPAKPGKPGREAPPFPLLPPVKFFLFRVFKQESTESVHWRDFKANHGPNPKARFANLPWRSWRWTPKVSGPPRRGRPTCRLGRGMRKKPTPFFLREFLRVPRASAFRFHPSNTGIIPQNRENQGAKLLRFLCCLL
jgi:hypothetical protein